MQVHLSAGTSHTGLVKTSASGPVQLARNPLARSEEELQRLAARTKET